MPPLGRTTLLPHSLAPGMGASPLPGLPNPSPRNSQTSLTQTGTPTILVLPERMLGALIYLSSVYVLLPGSGMGTRLARLEDYGGRP